MSARFSVPAVSQPAGGRSRVRRKECPRALPRVVWKERRGPLLHPTPLAPNGEVLGLNISAGCAHQCCFCAARAYASYPGDDVVNCYTDSAQQVGIELSARRKRPRAVLLCPSTDPFPPLSEVQAETGKVIDVLAAHHVEAWLLTRGYIRPAALRVMQKHQPLVKVTIGLTSLDRDLQQLLEPLAAPPGMRLRQIAQLRALGLAVQVALEPLVPGLTDTPGNLTTLLKALAEVGIRHVTAGYMFLRPGIRDNVVEALADQDLAEVVLEPFEAGPILKCDSVAAAQYLSKTRRQRGYSTLMAIAAEQRISVSVSRITNPDFQVLRQPLADPQTRQRLLFLR